MNYLDYCWLRQLIGILAMPRKTRQILLDSIRHCYDSSLAADAEIDAYNDKVVEYNDLIEDQDAAVAELLESDGL